MEFSTPSGTSVITDCMPLYPEEDGSMPAFHQIIRRAQCIRGSVELGILYEPRPDYARQSPSLQGVKNQVLCGWNDSRLVLTCPAPLKIIGDRAEGRIHLNEGQDAWFLLAYSDAANPTPGSTLTLEQRFDATERFWCEKAAAVRYDGPWREQVVRSYLALHLLTYLPTGAIVAAPTTSLPEAIGGVRNWDYRYTWLRDAAFTIDALLSVGHSQEALAFFLWLGQVCARYADAIQIMHRVEARTTSWSMGCLTCEGTEILLPCASATALRLKCNMISTGRSWQAPPSSRALAFLCQMGNGTCSRRWPTWQHSGGATRTTASGR
jgi:GH15 family glucan-1,4-alpha-glucosidase